MRVRRSIILSMLVSAALLQMGAVQATGVSGQGTWETTLQPRDVNGDGTVDAFYDTVLDLSWLANGNVAGPMEWADAMQWAATLELHGITGWRLPTMIDTGAPGCDLSFAGGTDCGYNVQTISQDGQTVFSELAHLYYESLGNKGYCAPGANYCGPGQPGWGLTNTGAFGHLQSWFYWIGLVQGPAEYQEAWYFDTEYGYQSGFGQGNLFYAIAVRPGDVAAAVPEPQTAALLLMGMAGVMVAARQQAVSRLR
jgi:hypothetical protein